MAKISDIDIPSTLWQEQGSAPATPASTKWRLYFKAAGLFHRDDAGVEVGPMAAAGGTDLAGKELDYVQFTSPVLLTATSEATANVIVTGSSVSYDGSTIILIEFYAYQVYSPDQGVGRYTEIILYDDTAAASLGILARVRTPATGFIHGDPVYVARRLTPASGARTYSIRGWASVNSNAEASAGTGGAGAAMPGFIRITRVTS